MCGHPILGNLMHFRCPQLDLNFVIFRADDTGMKRLIAIALWR